MINRRDTHSPHMHVTNTMTATSVYIISGPQPRAAPGSGHPTHHEPRAHHLHVTTFRQTSLLRGRTLHWPLRKPHSTHTAVAVPSDLGPIDLTGLKGVDEGDQADQSRVRA
jgi:hypothetical protein